VASTSERDQLSHRLFSAKSALIISHIMPDADTLGAALALGLSLRPLGIEVHLACQDPVPAELRFLPSADEIQPRMYSGEEVIVTVDISDQPRIGKLYDERVFSTVPVLVIDHHITNTRFGTWNWVADVPATSEMVLEMLEARGVPISQDIATCLLAGIIGDTQCFMTSNTAPSSLKAAARLQALGANLQEIAATVLNRRPASALAVWREAFNNVYQEGGILITTLSNQFLRSVGADDSSTNGLSSWLAGLDGVLIAAVLREGDDGSVDVSMRSVPTINLAEAAKNLGGGGHPQAAGCVLPGPLPAARERLLQELRPLTASTKRSQEAAG